MLLHLLDPLAIITRSITLQSDVTNILLYLTTDVAHSPVSSWNIQASSTRGDNSYPWVSVHGRDGV